MAILLSYIKTCSLVSELDVNTADGEPEWFTWIGPSIVRPDIADPAINNDHVISASPVNANALTVSLPVNPEPSPWNEA